MLPLRHYPTIPSENSRHAHTHTHDLEGAHSTHSTGTIPVTHITHTHPNTPNPSTHYTHNSPRQICHNTHTHINNHTPYPSSLPTRLRQYQINLTPPTKHHHHFLSHKPNHPTTHNKFYMHFIQQHGCRIATVPHRPILHPLPHTNTSTPNTQSNNHMNRLYTHMHTCTDIINSSLRNQLHTPQLQAHIQTHNTFPHIKHQQHTKTTC